MQKILKANKHTTRKGSIAHAKNVWAGLANARRCFERYVY